MSDPPGYRFIVDEAGRVSFTQSFYVDTPAASAVDLGCVYELEVGDDGGGMLEVIYGWVSLEAGSRHGGGFGDPGEFQAQVLVRDCHQATSRISASPWPPPPHSVAAPSPPPRCCKVLMSVTNRRAPVAPIG